VSAPAILKVRQMFQVSARFMLFVVVVISAGADYAFNRRHRRNLATRARWLQSGCRRALRVLRVSLTATGPAPKKSVLVANHLGYLDVLALAASTPVVFVAKREVRDWPVFGWFARMAGTRFIDRENRADVIRVANELAAPLAEGVSVVLFLEGTSTDGRKVLPFKSSLLQPVVSRCWPVAPAAMAFRVPDGHSASDEVCWWGGMTLVPHFMNLLRLPWIEARLAWGAAIVAAGDRKRLAADLRERVIELQAALQRVHETSEPCATAHVDAIVEASA
jgi:1-acyl-sn-glycerol-3-phosphate acyltransferase